MDSSPESDQLLRILEMREPSSTFVALRRRVRESLEVSAGDRVVEAGCGTGMLVADLVDLGLTTTGVDASECAIARARTRFPGADFRVASADKLPLADRECVGYAR